MSQSEGYARCPVVNSFNEWDLLEEAIVGIIDGASVPPWHICLEATMPENYLDFYRRFGGQPFPKEQVDVAKTEWPGLCRILEAEGVLVKRPEAVDHSKGYSTPEWESPCGLYAAMPRDCMLVIGNEIIEAPMAWRSRYFETHAFRSLIKHYFRHGAKWTAAPKPQLSDALYDYDYSNQSGSREMKRVINEYEPTFDAADFVRCGKDILAQKSHVTNSFGIEWLRRHLGDQFTIHELKFADPHPMHIDATTLPLAPGKLLVNPERVKNVPPIFKNWEILYAPKPCIPDDYTLYMTSKWINMNLLMLDEERVVVEKQEQPMISALKDWGFKPILCSFREFNRFGGSFHCATLDIRRRGTLQSYF